MFVGRFLKMCVLYFQSERARLRGQPLGGAAGRGVRGVGAAGHRAGAVSAGHRRLLRRHRAPLDMFTQ